MATTTNYGWTTPDDTALVKDGASAIRTLGTSVDTTTKNLNPSTTLGDIEYRSSTANTNTRVGIGTSGQALTVVAGAPSWAASATSVLTTTGDSLYASAANTLARLGIGTTGQVLTVAAGLPSWATPASGSMTLLSTTTLSGASTTISGISGAYIDLFILVYGVTNATADGLFSLAPNGSGITSTSFVDNTASFSTNTWYLANTNPTRTNADNAWGIFIRDYASATNYKPVSWSGVYVNAGSNRGINGAGGTRTNSAITSLVFTNSGGNHSTGTVEIYGVK